MAFLISAFTRLRPFAYHLTDRANLRPLASRRLLEPAADLLARAGHANAVRSRRAELMPIWVEGQRVVLKDHKPLIFANAELPLFCPFNSGAPRMQSGQRVPRGPDLFTPAGRFSRRASDVVELVFEGSVVLPETTQFRFAGWDWETLSSAAI